MAKNYERPDDWENKFKEWKNKKIPSQTPEEKPLEQESSERSLPKTEQNSAADSLSHEPQKEKTFVDKTLIFLAFAIPAAILLYGLYVNFLPFGWEKTYTLTLDEEGKVSPLSNEIYLTNSQGRKLLSLPNGVEGQVNIVIEPGVALKNATLNVEITGEDVYLALPLDLDPSLNWDNSWDFTQAVPTSLEGNADFLLNENCVYFNAAEEETLSLPNSQNNFEVGPMSLYLKWKPSETSQILGNYQQLIGHYNWEIFQGENSVRFQVGRMNNSQGPFYSVSYPITPDFFDQTHELLAVYSPNANSNGYIELWVDGNFAQRTSIGSDIIYSDYNSDRDLGFGWSSHNYGKYPYFDGCIYEAKLSHVAFQESKTNGNFNFHDSKITIPVIGSGNLSSIKVQVRQ